MVLRTLVLLGHSQRVDAVVDAVVLENAPEFGVAVYEATRITPTTDSGRRGSFTIERLTPQ